jgi:sugar phosphate permease
MRSSWSYSKNQLISAKILDNFQTGILYLKLGEIDMVFMLFYSLGLSTIGALGDSINRKYFLAFGYIICSLAFMVYPFSNSVFGESNLWILFVFMAINGLF